jgi:hypothetical protein
MGQVSRRFGETYNFHPQGRRIILTKKKTVLFGNSVMVCLFAYSRTAKIEVICFAETSVGFRRTSTRYVPEL